LQFRSPLNVLTTQGQVVVSVLYVCYILI